MDVNGHRQGDEQRLGGAAESHVNASAAMTMMHVHGRASEVFNSRRPLFGHSLHAPTISLSLSVLLSVRWHAGTTNIIPQHHL